MPEKTLKPNFIQYDWGGWHNVVGVIYFKPISTLIFKADFPLLVIYDFQFRKRKIYNKLAIYVSNWGKYQVTIDKGRQHVNHPL